MSFSIVQGTGTDEETPSESTVLKAKYILWKSSQIYH